VTSSDPLADCSRLKVQLQRRL